MYPSKSKERIFLYKGSFDYQWVSIDTPELEKMIKRVEMFRELELEEKDNNQSSNQSSN